ncbi:MAG: glycoside hydrolase family 16 protein [Rhodocyclaceae bacterium]
MRDTSLHLPRRDFICRTGAVAGSLWLPPGVAWAADTVLDFRGGIPEGVRFRRAGTAHYTTAEGLLRHAAVNVPRFPSEAGKALGLLIEGEGRNPLGSAAQARAWAAGEGTGVEMVANETAPDGSRGVLRIRRGLPAANSSVDAIVPGPLPWSEYSTVSVWLRSTSGPGKWRLRLRDFSTYNGVATVVEVGPVWRRYALSFAWQMKDIGPKRFSVLANEAPAVSADPPAIFLLNRINPYEPVATALTLDSVLMWGAQYEDRNRPSSFMPGNGSNATRAMDEVTFAASRLPTTEGALSFVLPQGGRRSGVIIDAAGEQGGIRLGYSASGWLVATVGDVSLAGQGDATADTVVRLEWSKDGVQISSGDRPLALSVRAVQKRKPASPKPGDVARLGMTLTGERPLNSVIASVTISKSAAALGQLVLPSIIPVSYLPSFVDDFDNNDVSRINENASGGKEGAPAWRSRLRQSRQEVINKEKQIYMDPAFTGTGSQPLGVQPFSIQNGVLRIRADKADPQRIAPYIWNYRYTSGCISSELTHWQTYGYFEMRARLPRGKGFWPAFWLLPRRNAWPPEIDVLEGSGARPYGVHCGVLEKPREAKTPPGAWIDQLIDTSDGFHTYAVDWTQANIIFYVDGTKTFEYGPHGIHEEMYLIANLALGSHDPNWIPDPDDTTPLPGFMDIDYIRAFKRAA